MLRIGIVAGEASGDQLGADLIAALRRRFPTLIVEGMAGPRMRELGCGALATTEELSVMGIVEVAKHYRRLRALRERLISHFLASPPDLFVGIDVPDFVLHIEARLKAAGVLTAHYVCPQVWAWREERVAIIRRATDLVLTLFPFEAPFLQARNVNATYVGHPLADRLPLMVDRKAARAALELDSNGTYVALLPGSRRQEYARHQELFLQTARALWQTLPHVKFLYGAVNPQAGARVRQALARAGEGLPIEIVMGRSLETLSAADAALCASGTVTLEAALTKTPAVVTYRMAALSFAILRRLVKTRWVALPNLLTNRPLMPELLQEAATAPALAAALRAWLTDAAACDVYRTACLELHHLLRNNAAEAAAAALADLVRARSSPSAAYNH